MTRPAASPARLRRALVAGVARLSKWVLVAALATPVLPALARQDAALERSVKAAFLYKFLGYTDFPAHAFSDPGAAIVIGVAGSDDMAAEVRRIVAGRTIGGRPVTVRSLREGETMAPVHLLFVAGSDCARVARILRQSSPGPILSVSECGNGLQAGSTINFKIIDQHVRFDVSLDAAEKNNIKLSSRLLSVANHVSKGAP
ncbi:MAG: hypothetical protein JWP59_3887 [Massilia sp.]|jgi:hypothetical protein|nr:hypothetical protein [Massilia sp.]